MFSIIIPNYNKADGLRNFLDSLLQSCGPDVPEIFFMDDASTDDSVSVASRYPISIHVGSTRVGPAVLRNRAARLANGRFLVFMDSDLILFDDTISSLRAWCQGVDSVGFTALESLPCAVDNWIGAARTLMIQEIHGGDLVVSQSTPGWGATFGVLKRDLFLKVGGFNEAYGGADIEDHELAERLRGYPLSLEPSVRFRHTYRSMAEVMYKQMHRSRLMVQLGTGALLENRAFFGFRYKAGHLASLALFGTMALSAFQSQMAPWIPVGLFLKCLLHRRLIQKALLAKGPLFALYVVGVHSLSTLFVVSGLLLGLSPSRGKPLRSRTQI